MVTQCPNALNWYMCPHQHSTPLLHAISKGLLDTALYLMQCGCDPYTDPNKLKFPGLKSADVITSKALFRTVEKWGFEKVFKKMLEKAEKLVVDKNGDTVLHVIVRKKSEPLFEAVLASRWLQKMLHHANNQGYLPLHVAASSNFLPFFQIFFQSQILNSHILPDTQVTSLLTDKCDKLKDSIHDACSNLSINAPVKVRKTTALHLAASERSVQMVQLLLNLGADVNASDEAGKTPLVECLDLRGDKNISQSSACDLLHVCQILIGQGAGVNVKSNIRYSERRSMANDDVLTPLHLAAGVGSKDIVELLLNNGANPCLLSGDIGKIPLQFALEQGHNDAASSLMSPELYPSGFLSSHMDYAFNSLLHYADRCNTAVISELINLSNSLDRPNVNRLRPLDKAISSRNIEYVELLLITEPCIVNVHLYQDPAAYPPLHLAASSGNVRLCQTLLSYGADIYARAFGKHKAFRKAFKFDRFDTGVYLCEQMSRPFTKLEREEVTSQELALRLVRPDLAARLRHRLDEVPTLVMSCLDVIRTVFISTHLSFKEMHTLPVPDAVIKALRYQNTDFLDTNLQG